MADSLHEALGKLSAIEYNDVPDDLPSFLKPIWEAGELICNSVPAAGGGQDFAVSKPAFSEPDQATSAKTIHASETRSSPSLQLLRRRMFPYFLLMLPQVGISRPAHQSLDPEPSSIQPH